MSAKICGRCKGYFHRDAEECPKCGSPNFIALFPGDPLYKNTALVCFHCTYSIKRRSVFVKNIRDDPKIWNSHFRKGQIYCYRRAPLWVSRDGCCPEFYQLIRRPKTKLKKIVRKKA